MSRNLILSELIVSAGGRRSLVRPLSALPSTFPNDFSFTTIRAIDSFRVLVGRTHDLYFCSSRIRTLVAMEIYSFDGLMMGKC